MNYSLDLGPATIFLQAERPPLDPDHEFILPFISTPVKNPTLMIRLHFAEPPRRTTAVMGEFARHWRLYPEGNDYRMEIFEQVTFKPKQIVFIRSDWSVADLYLIPVAGSTDYVRERNWYLGEIFEPFVQWWLTSVLALRAQGLILHSSGVCCGDRALVFFGRSSAGKTTLARLFLSAGHTVLNDERIILWKEKGTWMAGGSPWHGQLRQITAHRAPLLQITGLQKSKVNEVVPQSSAVLMRRLIPQAFVPLWSPAAMAGLLECAQDLLESVPSGIFKFQKNASAVKYLEEKLLRTVEMA